MWSCLPLYVISTIAKIYLTTDERASFALNQQYHRHVVQTYVWSCQVLTLVHLEKLCKVNQTESKLAQAVEISLSFILLKIPLTLRCI
jgi:hypothetical protein